MTDNKHESALETPHASPTPIKMPNPPEDTQPEIEKVGSRDAPGG
jgi:hypothetical protein